MDNKIGFIGLGIMGKPMSLNLVRAGFDVTVYNRTESKTSESVSQGAMKVNTPAEAAAASTVIITLGLNSFRNSDVLFSASIMDN